MLICMFNSFLSFLEVIMQFIFFTKYAERKFLLSYVPCVFLGVIISNLSASFLIKYILFFMLLFSFGTYILNIDYKKSLSLSITTMVIIGLSYGITNSIISFSAIYFYKSHSVLFSFIASVLGNTFSIVLAYICYSKLYKYVIMSGKGINKAEFPGLFMQSGMLLATIYISQIFYGNVVDFQQLYFKNPSLNIFMFFIQLFGIFSILSVFFLFKELIYNYDSINHLVIKQNESMYNYSNKIKAVYNATSSFRHDIKNHLLVLKKLVSEKNYSAAETYLKDISIVSDSLSLTIYTNNPIVDAIIEEKCSLEISKYIVWSIDIYIPYNIAISNFELCTIFSNLIDNAISACSKINKEMQPFINIKSYMKNNLFFISIENSFNGNRHFFPNIGLKNIKDIVDKYNGELRISIIENNFNVDIMFNISKH